MYPYMAILSKEYPPKRIQDSPNQIYLKKYNHFLLRVFILFPEKIHLASQAGKIQIRIISVPEIMWPKNGTNMIGFLPESEKTLKIEITCTSVYLVQSLFYLKVGRDTEKPIQTGHHPCNQSTFCKCSPRYHGTEIIVKKSQFNCKSITIFIERQATCF